MRIVAIEGEIMGHLKGGLAVHIPFLGQWRGLTQGGEELLPALVISGLSRPRLPHHEVEPDSQEPDRVLGPFHVAPEPVKTVSRS